VEDCSAGAGQVKLIRDDRRKENRMISVELVNWSIRPPVEMASEAGLTCYSPEKPEEGKLINVEKRLFNPGHHTTFQHLYYTFFVEGVAVGDVTFGLHLSHPFYNSSQRSGRFCTKMFSLPNMNEIESYLTRFWPSLAGVMGPVSAYMSCALSTYSDNMPRATELAAAKIRKERPRASEKYIATNAPKIAMEQMRSFIPVVFPTALEFTMDFTAIAALYRVAWTPSLRFVVGEMVRLIVERWPEASFAFKEAGADREPWFLANSPVCVKNAPTCHVQKTRSSDYDSFVSPTADEVGPLDLLHFAPWLMNNRLYEIKDEVELSVATMGQDQRHRTIERGQPTFTSAFYMPPIPRELGLEGEATLLMQGWLNRMRDGRFRPVGHLLAPYGSMVSYGRSANLAAAIHEGDKRLCFCSQEEIYEVARQRREQLVALGHPIVPYCSPPCISRGVCPEGDRHCGRDPKTRKDNPFPYREV